MGEQINHRGPDWLGAEQRADFGCVHTRLSIVDLSAVGNQPFTNDRYVLAYNGEIYNHAKLRAEFLEPGIAYRGTSDTATLFELLIHHGVPTTLRKIRGMFAFAFFDRLKGTLYLARDRYGIKPLMWTQTNKGFYWASEVKALRPVLNLEPDPVKTLFATCGMGDQSAEETVFRGVRQVPPGKFLVVRAGETPKLETYYTLADQVNPEYYFELQRMHAGELTDHFVDLLGGSARSMLMSDAKMGSFVSGGVDSSLVTALATNGNGKLTLFTSDVSGRLSEFEDANLLSKHLGQELVPDRFRPEQLVEDWARVTWHYEAPIVKHTNAVPFASVARTARENGVKAVLTGEGSDELFLGYPRLLSRRYDGLIRLPLTLIQRLYRLVPKLGEYVAPTRNINDFLALVAQKFERQRLRDESRKAFDFLPTAKGDEQYLTLQMFGEHLLSLLHRNDRMGMSASIEARFPFLDEDVVRFGVNLPANRKIGRSFRFHDFKHPFLEDKAIVRRAAARVLPPRLAQKRKQGFPMYGHLYMKLKPGGLCKGYLSDLLGIDRDVEALMLRDSPPYFIAKLLSVEVFGRLFALNQSPDAISEHLKRYVDLNIGSSEHHG